MALVPDSEDTFWDMVDDMPMGTIIPFESVDKDEHHVYQTPFKYLEREEIVVDPWSILRMRVKK